MSKEAAETGKKAVSLEELLVRSEQLKEYISQLESRITEITSQMAELQVSRETLSQLPQDGGEGLVATDNLSTAFIPIVIPKDWDKRVLVRIGLNYYLKTTSTEAAEVITRRLNAMRQLLQQLQQQYKAVAVEYTTLQQLLSKIYAQLKRGGAVGGASPPGAG